MKTKIKSKLEHKVKKKKTIKKFDEAKLNQTGDRIIDICHKNLTPVETYLLLDSLEVSLGRMLRRHEIKFETWNKK